MIRYSLALIGRNFCLDFTWPFAFNHPFDFFPPLLQSLKVFLDVRRLSFHYLFLFMVLISVLLTVPLSSPPPSLVPLFFLPERLSFEPAPRWVSLMVPPCLAWYPPGS